MRYLMIPVVCCLVLASGSRAEEKAEKAATRKPVGTWVREDGNDKLVFAIKADTLTIKLTTAQGRFTADASYGVTGDGTLFAILTKVEQKGVEANAEKGDLFSFAFSATRGELTVSNLKGTRINEHAQKLVEGVYSLRKKK